MDFGGKKYCDLCFSELAADGVCSYCGHLPDLRRPGDLPAGTLLNGKYVVGKVSGRFGLLLRYLAFDRDSGRKLSLTEYYPQGSGGTNLSPNGAQYFLSEASTYMAATGDTNCDRIIDCFSENGTAYYVSEYIDGTSLALRLGAGGAPLSGQECTDAVRSILNVAEAAHDVGIVHCGICPDNIIFCRDGSVKLTGFSGAVFRTAQESGCLPKVIRQGYTAPEISQGKITPATDIYSLGAVMYFALTGKVPVSGGKSKPVFPNGAAVSPALRQVIQRCLRPNPSERYQSIAELSAELAAAGGASPAPANAEAAPAGPYQAPVYLPPANYPGAASSVPGQNQPGSAAQGQNKKKKLIIIISAAAALILAGLIVWLIAAHRSKSPADVKADETVSVPSDKEDFSVVPDNYFVIDANGVITSFSPDYVGTLAIPETIGGVRVTGIGDSAFAGCAGLAAVSIPSGVKSIGRSAFAFCQTLEVVYIPQEVTYIGGLAFSGCPQTLTVRCDSGSYAAGYCADAGISCSG